MAEEKTYVFGNDSNSLPLAYALNGNGRKAGSIARNSIFAWANEFNE